MLPGGPTAARRSLAAAVTAALPSLADARTRRLLDFEGRVRALALARHIGPKRARWLAERHGDRVLAVVGADPRRAFLSVPGIGHRAAREAAESWDALRDRLASAERAA